MPFADAVEYIWNEKALAGSNQDVEDVVDVLNGTGKLYINAMHILACIFYAMFDSHHTRSMATERHANP